MTEIFVVAVFVAAYVLIATERIHRVAAALGGAAAMVALGVVDAHVAFYSERTGVDWNVIFLLLGMMIIVGILKQTGVFDFLAIWSAKKTKGRPFATMVMLVVITAVASAALDNVTTVLLIAPVTLLLCERLGLPPVPFLIAEALASNIGGTATLIGDPPNIIIASRAGLSFNDFLIHLAPIVVVLMVVFIGMCRVLFRSAFTYDPARVGRADGPGRARGDPRPRAARCARRSSWSPSWPDSSRTRPCTSSRPWSRCWARATWWRCPSSTPSAYLEEVEWATLVFFMGLFVMVGALVEVGFIGRIGAVAHRGCRRPVRCWPPRVLLWGSGVLSGIVDNIPYVATATPLVQDLVNAGQGSPQAHALWWALALGRRPRRQRHRCGGERERRRHRHRRPQRPPDLVLAVHQVRLGRRGRDDRGQLGLPVAALLRLLGRGWRWNARHE